MYKLPLKGIIIYKELKLLKIIFIVITKIAIHSTKLVPCTIARSGKKVKTRVRSISDLFSTAIYMAVMTMQLARVTEGGGEKTSQFTR